MSNLTLPHKYIRVCSRAVRAPACNPLVDVVVGLVDVRGAPLVRVGAGLQALRVAPDAVVVEGEGAGVGLHLVAVRGG